MGTFLHTLELVNFKTYKGKVTVGPIKPFSAVVGPNGTGKSNFMDAISFALGEKISKLRVSQAKDLINGAHVGLPVSDRASVTAIFHNNDTTLPKIYFTRTVSKSSKESYSYNQQAVSNTIYLAELEKLGVSLKHRNALVYQGTIETIAVLDAKQRTALFEEISGSKKLKKNYEELNKKLRAAEDVTQFTLTKKRYYREQLKETRSERGEVVKYEQLLLELDEKKIELELFKLFYNEKQIDSNERAYSKAQSNLEMLEKVKKETKEKIKEAKKIVDAESRETRKLEKELVHREKEVKQILTNPVFIKAKEEVSHVSKRLETAKKSLKSAEDTHEKHQKTKESLQEELSRVSEQLSIFQNQSSGDSDRIDIELQGSQVQEYKHRKQEAVRRLAADQQKLDSLIQAQQAIMDRLSDKERKQSELKTQIHLKTEKLVGDQKRFELLSQKISNFEEELAEVISRQESHVSCEKNLDSIQTELADVSARLIEICAEKHQEDTNVRRSQAIESLKRHFPGVYNRLENLCHPIHKRYAIALIKVMGMHMRHIVVDTENTAILCIKYLKEHMMEPETFLPLDTIEVKPLQDWLRKKVPMRIPFLFDTVKYDPQIKRAILFATKSTFVCETEEEAMKVAYESYSDRQLDAVSLNGTLFKKTGIMSGGTIDLSKKANHWNAKETIALKAALKGQKEKLSADLRELFKISRRESGLNCFARSEGLKARINFMIADRDKLSFMIDELERELSSLKENLLKIQQQIDEIQEEMQRKEQEINVMKKTLHSIEDKVFASFCKKIGVLNIRQYEEVGLKSYEERENQHMQYVNQRNRIQNQIDYENTIDTQENIQRWSNEVRLCKKALKSAEKEAKRHHQELEEAEANLERFRNTVAERKKEVGSSENHHEEVRQEMKEIDKKLQEANKKLLLLHSKTEHYRRICRSILLACQVENIAIPMLRGSLQDALLGVKESNSDTTSSASTALPSQATISSIDIDFLKLRERLKHFKRVEDIESCENQLKEDIMLLSHNLNSIRAPNMKVEERLQETSNKLKEMNYEFESLVDETRKTRAKFQKVKAERCKVFMDCFDFVSGEIDTIYKQLTKSSSAMALLTPEDPEEPYLGGISYCCIAPGKACKPMHSLSGGEKTIASIALIIALHMYCPSPCLVLDEIDAALDNINIERVASFLRNQRSNFQTIAISHRDEFCVHADALIGITSDIQQNDQHPQSKAYTFDLEVYPM